MRTDLISPTSRLAASFIATFASFLALSTTVVSAQQASVASAPPGPGDAAPPITLNALTNAPDGADTSWDAWGEGTTVIEFWGTWCAPCVAAIPHLNELHDAFAPKGVNFLSVTFEEPQLVDRFRQRMTINTWIGHDMDRAMVQACHVQSWPTTFIVRDGVIIARMHPAALNHDRLAAIVDGKDDPTPAAQHYGPGVVRGAGGPRGSGGPGADAVFGADGRPILRDGIRLGFDPYSMLQDEEPVVQVIVRKAGDMSMASFGPFFVTALGVNPGSMMAALLDQPPYAVVIDPEVTTERFDVI